MPDPPTWVLFKLNRKGTKYYGYIFPKILLSIRKSTGTGNRKIGIIRKRDRYR
jgi:hypothetical protein